MIAGSAPRPALNERRAPVAYAPAAEIDRVAPAV